MSADKVLLTGATGYLGNRLIAPLLALAPSVHVVVRDSAKGDALVAKYGSALTYSVLNLSAENIEEFKSLMRGASVFIHTAAMFSPEGVAFEQALAAAVVEVGRLAVDLGTKFHFVLTSGTLVYGEPGDVFTESSSTDNPNHLVAWKVPDERNLIAAAHSSFKVSIVRCTFMYPDSHVSTWAEAGKREGKLRTWQKLSNFAGFIHIEDLVELYRLIITKEAQGIFIGVDSTPVTIGQVLQKVQEVTGVTETEDYSSPFELLHSHGFYIYGQTVDQKASSERAEEIGWVRRYPSFLEAPRQV
jgi:nucleoside-diphosphate-sugar epimerase